MNRYLKKHSSTLVMSVVFTFLSSGFAILVQFFKGNVFDFALAGNGHMSLLYGIALGSLIILEISSYYFYNRSRGLFCVDCARDLRQDYFASVLRRKPPEFLKKKQGDYLAAYTNQLDVVSVNYLFNIPLLAEIIIKIILVSISLFILDYRIAIVTLILLTTPLYIPKIVEKGLQKARKQDVDAFENHLANVVEWLSGFELIKNYSVEKVILEKFDLSNQEIRNKGYAMRKMTYLAQLVTTCLSYFSHFIILIFAAWLVLHGEFTAGNFFVAISMIDQLSYPIISLSGYLQEMVSAKPICNELLSFVDYEENSETPKTVVTEPVDLEFKQVDFGYEEDKKILNGFNLSIKNNQKCLVKGPSGSGKSTCVNLLLAYYIPQEGGIRINGTSVEDIGNLGSLITVMRQDSLLFNDTLRNNLTMYQPIEDEILIDMLKKVGLSEYTSAKGLNYLISENGTNFSGGEKRRIALARTLLRNSPILVLDEPLANLDEVTARSIENEILDIRDRTVLIISHQFSPEKVTAFDKIVTL